MRKSVTKGRLFSLILTTLTTAGAAAGASAQAPRPPSPWKVQEAHYDIANFKFATGESLPTLRIHDATLRTPKRDARGRITNATWQFDASRTFHPEPDLRKIKAKILWVDSADDFRNPPEAGIAPRVAAKLKPEQFMLVPFGPDTEGRGTTMRPKFWKDGVAKLLAE